MFCEWDIFYETNDNIQQHLLGHVANLSCYTLTIASWVGTSLLLLEICRHRVSIHLHPKPNKWCMISACSLLLQPHTLPRVTANMATTCPLPFLWALSGKREKSKTSFSLTLPLSTQSSHEPDLIWHQIRSFIKLRFPAITLISSLVCHPYSSSLSVRTLTRYWSLILLAFCSPFSSATSMLLPPMSGLVNCYQ